MGFTIPDADDANHQAQAFLTTFDIEALAAAHAGLCVLSGCAVTQSANGPGMDVDTAAGYILVNGVVVQVSQSLDDAISSGNATYPRIDLVEVGANGTVDVVAGTPAAYPVPPEPSADHVPLATVFVDSSESTSVVTADIVDKRVLRPRRATRSVHLVDGDTATSTGNGVIGIPIDASLDGCVLADVLAIVETAGTDGTTTVQVRRSRGGTDADMLSTEVTIDSAEYDNTTAAAAHAINASNDDLATGDVIYLDVDAVHSTTPANGLDVVLTFADE